MAKRPAWVVLDSRGFLVSRHWLTTRRQALAWIEVCGYPFWNAARLELNKEHARGRPS